MKDKIQRFIKKHGISSNDILYIIRNGSRTCIHTSNGEVIRTYFSMKNLITVLNAEELICINKGIAVSCTAIKSIQNGIYTMSDGRTLRGRVRTPGEHKRNQALVNAKSVDPTIPEIISSDLILEKFSILDELPLPFAVFELIFGDDGAPVDILFRYLNGAMADLIGTTVSSTMGKSFYTIFENGDRKWLEINAEVALAGDARSIRRFSPELGRYLSLYYFRPLAGYCACALI